MCSGSCFPMRFSVAASFVFLQPEVFWGAVLCLLPAAIYWLLRPRPVKIRWGAMRFLSRAYAQTKKKTRFRDALRILCETLALASVLTAAAFPVWNSARHSDDPQNDPQNVSRSDSQNDSRRVCIFILDNSCSMAAPMRTSTNGSTSGNEGRNGDSAFSETRIGTRFEAARRACLTRIRFWQSRPEKPEIRIFPTVFSPVSAPKVPLRLSPEEVLNEIRPEKDASDWEETRKKLREMTGENTAAGKNTAVGKNSTAGAQEDTEGENILFGCAEVVIFSDFTENTDTFQDFLSELKKQTPNAEHRLVSAFQPVPNCSVSRVEFLQTPVLSGMKTPVRVTLRKDSETVTKNQLVELRVRPLTPPKSVSSGRSGDTLPPEKTEFTAFPPIPPQQKWTELRNTTEVAFSVEFPRPGLYEAEAVLNLGKTEKTKNEAINGFSYDDNRKEIISVQNSARFLIAEAWNPEFSQGRQAGAFYLQAALEAIYGGMYAEKKGEIGNFLRIDVRQDTDFSGWNLAPYDAVFLCGIPVFTQDEAVKMTEYVRNGGALWCFCGSQTSADSFEPLREILPGTAVGNEEETPEGTVLKPVLTDEKHEITDVFRLHSPSGLENVPIHRWTPLAFQVKNSEISENKRMMEHSGIQTVLNLSNGRPFLMLRELPGGGRTALSAVSADVSGSSLPLVPTFVPLVERTLHFLTSAPKKQISGIISENCPESESVSLNTSFAASVLRDGWSLQEAETCAKSGEWNVQKSAAAQILWLAAAVFLFIAAFLRVPASADFRKRGKTS